MLQRLLHHSSGAVLLLLNTTGTSTSSAAGNARAWKSWKQHLIPSATKGEHELLTQFYRGTCGLHCAIRPKEHEHAGCTKQQALNKLQRLAKDGGTRLLVLHYTGPSDGCGNPTFQNQELLVFEELVQQWRQMRGPSQHLLVVLDCPGCHQWVQQLAALPAADRLVLGLAVQAVECSAPAPAGAVSAWMVKQQWAMLGVASKAAHPSPALPTGITVQCSHCAWPAAAPADFRLPWIFMPDAKGGMDAASHRSGDHQAGGTNQEHSVATSFWAAHSSKRPSLDQAPSRPALSFGRVLKPMLSLPARGAVTPLFATKPAADQQHNASQQVEDGREGGGCGIEAVHTQTQQLAWPGMQQQGEAGKQADGPKDLTSHATSKAADADGTDAPVSRVFQQRLMVELRKEESQRMRRGRRGGLGGDEPFHELLNPAADDGVVSRSHSSALPLVLGQGGLDSSTPASPGSPATATAASAAVAAAAGARDNLSSAAAGGSGVAAQLPCARHKSMGNRELVPEASRLSQISRPVISTLADDTSACSLSTELLTLVPTYARHSVPASEQSAGMSKLLAAEVASAATRPSVQHDPCGRMTANLPPSATWALVQTLCSSTGRPLVSAASPALLHSILTAHSSASSRVEHVPRRHGCTGLQGGTHAATLFSDDTARWGYLQALVADVPELQQELIQLLPPHLVPSNTPEANGAAAQRHSKQASSMMMSTDARPESHALVWPEGVTSGPLIDAMITADAMVQLIQALQSCRGHSLAEDASPALLVFLLEANDSNRESSHAADSASQGLWRGRRAAMDGTQADDIFTDDVERWQYLRGLVAGDCALEQEITSLQPAGLQVAAHQANLQYVADRDHLQVSSTTEQAAPTCAGAAGHIRRGCFVSEQDVALAGHNSTTSNVTNTNLLVVGTQANSGQFAMDRSGEW